MIQLSYFTANDVHIWCGTGNISSVMYTYFRDDNVEYTQTASAGGSQGPNGFSLGRFAP